MFEDQSMFFFCANQKYILVQITTTDVPIAVSISCLKTVSPNLNRFHFIITVCLGPRNNIFSRLLVCSFELAMLEDMAKRRALLEDERLSPTIE